MNNKNEMKQIEDELNDILQNVSIEVVPDVNTQLAIAENGIGLDGLFTFIGLYLGLVFLVACTALLALKELS